jgi:hypothetical protein
MDAIVCPAATRESSVRADTDESDASGRTEAEETVILVTTSRALRDRELRIKGTEERHPHSVPRIQLMRLSSLFSYKDMIAAANKYMLT